MTDAPLPLDEATAHRLVGKFLQSFALLEQALNRGVGKVLGFDRDRTDIVCSSIPFAQKVHVFMLSEEVAAARPDAERKSRLGKARSDLFNLNDQRVIFAHCPFTSTPDGVAFHRVVAKEKLKVSTKVFQGTEIEALCSKARELADRLDDLVATMKPYVPALDFSDSRNSGYVALI